ncbi:hypothetical protein CS0771_13640 [Catellatospora sp. IY07-71]|uniref:type II secretion system F family protein n=1 Tax=Catellatospora sp. IY07-71 TaxID=2728827 RepID=UPI001BB3850B|nr:type II secretion system F family protein [Catellatospora sp. IY07-71]BCJ71820.1 hypothetical protein CS0771_13640 [Catellatospora sp. IY07-71]
MRRMLTVLPAAAAALLLGVGAPAVAAEPALTVSGLRREAGLVEFYLSAIDLPAGRSLGQVSVSADGQDLRVAAQQVVATATAATPRRGVVLVLDTSGSMAGEPIKAAQEAARGFLRTVPADVEIGVITAGAPAAVLQKATKDRAAALRAVDGLATKGETALYDGVRLASVMLGGGKWGQRRIVALSDGADTASTSNLAAVQKAVGTIPVDTIAFKTPDTTANVLAGLATGTGGTARTAADAAALSAAFAEASGSFSANLLVRVDVPAAMSGRQTRLAVTAGGVTTEVPVTFAVDTRAAGPLVGTPAAPPAPWWLWAVAGLVFLALLGVALVVVTPVMSASERRRRLAQVEQFTMPVRRGTPADANSQVTAAALALSEQVVKSANAEGRLALQLDRAGMRLRPHEWLLLRAAVCLAVALLCGLLLGPVPGVLLGPVFGWALTALYHRNRAARRVSAFRDLLPDALQLVVGSLRSGFSLTQAVEAMSRELPNPIAAEFGRALGETRLGVDIEDALDRVAVRMRSRELAWAVVAVRVQREVGGNLAEVLTTTVESMREREALYREVRSLSAEGRLSAWVLLGLPIGLALFMIILRGDYIRPLYTHPLGILMSIVGVVLVSVGGFWLSRMIRIEV